MNSHDTDPAAFLIDRLSAVREWLWRHSSQPNGDPWDSDPEHLDQTAQNLLTDLARWFPSIDVSGASGQDTELLPLQRLSLRNRDGPDRGQAEKPHVPRLLGERLGRD